MNKKTIVLFCATALVFNNGFGAEKQNPQPQDKQTTNEKAHTHPQIVTKENFKEIVLNSKKPVVVDVYAPWCPPCKYMLPIFEEVAQEIADQYTLVKLNCDESPELAEQYGVRGLPTLLFFKDGVLIKSHAGYLNKKQLMAKIEAVFESNK